MFFFLFLIFWFCYHHHHCHHLRHPLAPVSRKIHQIINITIQIPDPPILQSTTHLLLPTGHHPTHTPHTSHLTPQTTNLRLHPNSDPFLESPAQNHPTRVQIRVRSAHCALPVPVSRGSRLEIPGVRLRGRLAILVQSWNLESRVSGQLYAMCMCLRLVLILGLTPRRTKLSVNAPRSTPDPGLVLGCSNSSY